MIYCLYYKSKNIFNNFDIYIIIIKINNNNFNAMILIIIKKDINIHIEEIPYNKKWKSIISNIDLNDIII